MFNVNKAGATNYMYYGSESWAVNNNIHKQLEVIEIWLLRIMTKVYY
jgi:hypothetical protein